MWTREKLRREQTALADAARDGAPSTQLERLLRAVATVEGYVTASEQLDEADDVVACAAQLLTVCRGRTSIGLARADGFRQAVAHRLQQAEVVNA